MEKSTGLRQCAHMRCVDGVERLLFVRALKDGSAREHLWHRKILA